MNKSTMFLNNVTAIDYAYVDEEGRMVGGSVNPTIFVSGDIDPVEAVVVDFSSIKKTIKNIIDAKFSGFDHKLWIIDDYSNAVVNYGPADEKGPNFTINTPLFEMTAPRDAFKFITGQHGDNYKQSVIDQMEKELVAELNLDYPNVGIDISLDFDETFWGNSRMDTKMIPFRYAHGLKNSTSWGCKNIGHGHLSYLAASTTNVLETELLLMTIAADLDKTIFVWEDNMSSEMCEPRLIVSYKTDRGNFEMRITEEYAAVHGIKINTETTIENLAEAIARQYKSELVKAGVLQLFVSEGLNKGAVAEIY